MSDDEVPARATGWCRNPRGPGNTRQPHPAEVVLRSPSFTIDLDPTPLAPSIARRALSGWLRSVDCADQTKFDVLLIASELVTNAVLHTQTPTHVVAMFDDGRLRLEVHDRDETPPTLRTDGDLLSGHGLRIVSRIADGWGWEPTPAGKRVWVETLC